VLGSLLSSYTGNLKTETASPIKKDHNSLWASRFLEGKKSDKKRVFNILETACLKGSYGESAKKTTSKSLVDGLTPRYCQVEAE